MKLQHSTWYLMGIELGEKRRISGWLLLFLFIKFFCSIKSRDGMVAQRVALLPHSSRVNLNLLFKLPPKRVCVCVCACVVRCNGLAYHPKCNPTSEIPWLPLEPPWRDPKQDSAVTEDEWMNNDSVPVPASKQSWSFASGRNTKNGLEGESVLKLPKKKKKAGRVQPGR